MAKSTKTREELIAEENAKAKAVADAKQAELDALEKEVEKEDPPLSPEVEAARLAALKENAEAPGDGADDETETGAQLSVPLAGDTTLDQDPRTGISAEGIEKAKAAARKLGIIAQDVQASTPNEHILFGRAGIIFNVGDLRALFKAGMLTPPS